jgi:fumarylpyruvate hydrolase
MSQYIIDPPTIVTLPVCGEDTRFPVRRIYCVGKNYKKHVAEMGGDPKKSQPVFFTKSRETIVQSKSDIPYPPHTQNLHFEVELVVAMASPTEIFGYGVGLDMTRRDLQAAAKAKGGPWDMAKNFDHCAPCSALTPAYQIHNLETANISLRKNGKTVQSSSLDKMIWSISDIIKHLSASVSLQAGDLIFTGTPEGVGPVVSGDQLDASVTGLAPLHVKFTDA